MQKWTTRFFEEEGLMSNYVILENVADERGESAAKVARTLLRLGCDLYLRFGPSREPYIGENFFPEHPTVEMKYKIDPGDYTLTKESQEAVIKRLGRGDASTLGLFVRIDTKVDSSKTVSYQIELTEKDDSICGAVDPEDIATGFQQFTKGGLSRKRYQSTKKHGAKEHVYMGGGMVQDIVHFRKKRGR